MFQHFGRDFGTLNVKDLFLNPTADLTFFLTNSALIYLCNVGT